MNRNKGYILISLLIFFSIISLVLLSFHRFFQTESLKVQAKYENTRAYYLAESSAILYYHGIIHEVKRLANENFGETCSECFDRRSEKFYRELNELLQNDRFWNTMEMPSFKTYTNEYQMSGEFITLNGEIHYRAIGEYGNTEIIYYMIVSYPEIFWIEDKVSITLPKITSYYQGF